MRRKRQRLTLKLIASGGQKALFFTVEPNASGVGNRVTVYYRNNGKVHSYVHMSQKEPDHIETKTGRIQRVSKSRVDAFLEKLRDHDIEHNHDPKPKADFEDRSEHTDESAEEKPEKHGPDEHGHGEAKTLREHLRDSAHKLKTATLDGRTKAMLAALPEAVRSAVDSAKPSAKAFILDRDFRRTSLRQTAEGISHLPASFALKVSKATDAVASLAESLDRARENESVPRFAHRLITRGLKKLKETAKHEAEEIKTGFKAFRKLAMNREVTGHELKAAYATAAYIASTAITAGAILAGHHGHDAGAATAAFGASAAFGHNFARNIGVKALHHVCKVVLPHLEWGHIVHEGLELWHKASEHVAGLFDVSLFASVPPGGLPHRRALFNAGFSHHMIKAVGGVIQSYKTEEMQAVLVGRSQERDSLRATRALF